MSSFFALVKNEYIKIYKKTSTRIMLVIFLAAVLCFAPLMKLINHIAIKEFASWDSSDYMVDEIERKKREFENNEDIPFAEYKLELCDAVDSAEDWQTMAFYKGMASQDKQEIQRLTMICKMDDWRGFCKFMEENTFDEGEKWAYGYRLEHDIGFGEEFAKQNALIDNVTEAMSGYDSGLGGDGLTKTEKIAIGKYQLENEIYDNTSVKGGSLLNIDLINEFEFWDVFIKTPFLVTGIGIIMIVLAGSTVASEFSQGTVKFLLINPVRRGKILMAKYFTVMSLGFLLIITLMVLSIPMIGIFFGFDGFTAPYLAVKDGEVVSQSSFIYLFKTYMLASVEIVVTTTLALMISSLLRSTALAIVAGFMVRSIGSGIISVMAMLNMDWGRYLIFANTDLLAIANGESPFPQHTVAFALVVIAAHLAVFILTAWDGFTRRSV